MMKTYSETLFALFIIATGALLVWHGMEVGSASLFAIGCLAVAAGALVVLP